ncbi:hypothetical protein WH47_10960, partial [Habropoda laboriosa]
IYSRNDTIHSGVYCARLGKLREAIVVELSGLLKRHRVNFHHDRATPRLVRKVRQKLGEFD